MGSSGGGSSSGAVSYPAYMETQHGAWLTDLDTAIGAAASSSPYASATAYNPDCLLNATNVVLSQFNDVVIALDPATTVALGDAQFDDFVAFVGALAVGAEFTDVTTAIDALATAIGGLDVDILAEYTAAQSAITSFGSAIAAVDVETEFSDIDTILTGIGVDIAAITPSATWLSTYDSVKAKYTAATNSTLSAYTFTSPFTDAEINTNIAAYSAEVSARLTNDTLPAYKVGMQNINAVMTSAFTIGSALITAQGTRDVNMYSSNLRIDNQKNKLGYEDIKSRTHVAHNQLLAEQDKNLFTQQASIAQISVSGTESLMNAIFQKIKSSVDYGQITVTKADSLVNAMLHKADFYDKLARVGLAKAEGVARDLLAHATVNKDINALSFDLANTKVKNMFNEALLYHSLSQVGLARADLMMKSMFQEADFYGAVSQQSTEANRIKIIAKSEQTNTNYAYDEKDVLWGIDLYKHGAGMLAAISGGVPATDVSGASKFASALGGAASGAAMGSQIMPGWGTAIGAVAGGIAGLLS